jgi:feruloyl esterase
VLKWAKLLIPICVLAWADVASARQACERLADIHLPHTTIVSAAMIPEGPYAGPGSPASPGPAITLPSRCEVKGVIRPTKDSEIKFELWLPSTGWNGKYRQQGNGGWAGAINYASLFEPLRRGYAVASTDDGHETTGLNADWAIGHPEKLIDFGYRAVHETSVQSKAIVRAFYGREIERSYFDGCSDGGREALMEAQRYPDDFDGILAGAPANNWSRLFTGFVWNEHALLVTPGGAIPPAKLPVIQNAVLAACDSIDGVEDGLVQDPRACKFDPRVLLCKGSDGQGCLSPLQVEALGKIYGGPRNPRSMEPLFTGQPPGTEAVPGTWATWITSESAASAIQFRFGNSYYGAAVFEDPNWDFRTMDFDRDVRIGDAKAGPILNATNPDLRSLRAAGGKLIQYHGWGDAAIPATSSIEYYESVRRFMSDYPDARTPGNPPIEDFYRLFMVPGMGHCVGGTGPNRFGQGLGTASVSRDPEHDIFAALERWVEQGIAPDRLIGTGRSATDAARPLTRPLCPYPQVAQYRAGSDINDAASFTCPAAASPR